MNSRPIIGNRTQPRFQVLDCRVQLKSNGIFGLFGKKIYNLSLIDLSAAGIQAIASKTIDDQKEYDIVILAPAFRQPITAKGRVVWHKPYVTDDQKRYYRIGLEFTYFKDQSMKKIKHLESNPGLREIAGN